MLIAKALSHMSFEFNGYSFTLKPKDKLLFANDVFVLLPENIKKQFEVKGAENFSFYNGENLNGKTLLVFAQAAIGDALCMTPALREIKRRYPEMKLWVTISGRARPVLENLPYIDQILPHPCPIKYVNKADYFVKLVEMVGKPEFNNVNMVEYFFWKFHIYQAEKEIPDVIVDENIKKELKEVFNKIKEASGRNKILLFHYLASSVHRTLPPKLLKDIEDLIWEEYAPVICSLPEEDISVEVALDVYGIRAANLSSFMKNVKYLIAAVSLSDAVITADTATVHIAAGLKKPTVLISGAIEPELRCKTYPTVIPIRPYYKGKDCMSPCMIHAIAEPCNDAKLKKQFYSPCLESIPPKIIYQALKDAELLCNVNRLNKKICPVCKATATFFEIINENEIWECPSCKLQFAPSEKNIKESSENVLNSNFLNQNETLFWEVIFPILASFKGGSILKIQKTEENVFEKKLEKIGLNIQKVKDLTELKQLKENSFKFIVIPSLLNNIRDPLTLCKTLYNLLEEEGLLIVGCYSVFKFENMVSGQKRYNWKEGLYPPLVNMRWSPLSLFHLLKVTGFSENIIFTTPVFPEDIENGLKFRTVEILQPQHIVLPISAMKVIVLDFIKFIHLESHFLGNYLIGMGIKGKVDLDKIINRSLKFIALNKIFTAPKKEQS